MEKPAGYEYFEHTADVGLRAWGRDLPEAFAEAARGFVNVMVALDEVRPVEAKEIALPGEEPPDLLVSWLNELLFYFDSEGFIPCTFEVREAGDQGLIATARGERFDPARHPTKVGVKAATYHLAKAERRDSGYLVQVILDV